MSYFPELDIRIEDKVKGVLDLSNHVTKKELQNATGVDTSDLAAKSDVFILKAKVGKLDINSNILRNKSR